jgi:predicted dehydrogenase
LKELVDLGRLGELYYLRVDWCGAPGDSPGNVWTLCAEPLAVLPYLLDDEPVEVAARAESYAEPDVVELLGCHFRFATGITVQLHASVLEPRACARFAVVGSRRMAVFDEVEAERTLTVYERPSGVRGRAGRIGEIVCPQLRDGDPLVLALEYFVDSVRERGAETTAPAPGVAAVHLIEALQESIVRGGAAVPIHGGSVAAASAPVIQLPLRRE